jgi:hypothetical protein
MSIEKTLRMAAASLLLALCVGCATSRSEIDVAPPSLDLPAASAATKGKVYISAVDERVFETKPRSADIPSLKHAEIGDKSITGRAVGRKRNGYGKALGDVLLPSGRTVSALVGESVAAAYRQAGYEVVSTPNTTGATEVKVHIKEFWSWFSPGFFYVTVNNKSHLDIETAGRPKLKIVTLKSDGMQAVTDSDWKAITEAGLREIAQETASKL